MNCRLGRPDSARMASVVLLILFTSFTVGSMGQARYVQNAAQSMARSNPSDDRWFRVVLMINGLPRPYSTHLYVDDANYKSWTTVNSETWDGQPGSLGLDLGTHVIKEDQIVGGTPGGSMDAPDGSKVVMYDDRYFCKNNLVTVTSSVEYERVKVSFSYVKQHHLEVISAYYSEKGGCCYYDMAGRFGNPSGTGWYDDGTEAAFSISSTKVQISDRMYVFEGWEALDAPSGYTDWVSPGISGAVMMSGHWTIAAVWKPVTDSSNLFLTNTVVPVVIVVVVATTVVALIFRSRLGSSKVARYLKSESRSGEQLSSSNYKYCAKCRCRLPVAAQYCDACGTKQPAQL